MVIMYLSIENSSCPKEQVSLYLSMLKQLTLLKNSMKPVNCVDPDQLASEEVT